MSLRMMGMSAKILLLVLLPCFAALSGASLSNVTEETVFLNVTSSSTSVTNGSEVTTIPPQKTNREWSGKNFERTWKRVFKYGVKMILPRVMNFSGGSTDSVGGMSPPCLRSLIKYIGGLTNAKMWAVKMFDATSKPAAGLFEGTFSDFGAFDQCLDISVPQRDGKEEFRGTYCAIEARPVLPPQPKNFSMAHRNHAAPHEAVAKEIMLASGAFYYLKFRLGACLPSTCKAEDFRGISKKVGERINMEINIPTCYVKEDTVVLSAIHVVMILVILILTTLCAVGTWLDFQNNAKGTSPKSVGENILLAFSVIRNYEKLISGTKGSGEMKALHGIRGLSIAWVVLGHTHVWTNFQLLRRPSNLQDWFHQVDFEALLNAWLAVESFFLLSGLLTCYGCMQLMAKTKGRINIPLFIIRRYIRLMPPLLIVMGLVFFLPLVSSGPFWYERVDPELESCTYNWWTSILFISNWTSMKSICIHPTWFMSADFQLHIFSLIILYPLYRSWKLGTFVMATSVLAGTLAVAVTTYVLELPPIVQIASGNDAQITETVDKIHMRTFTHLGPFVVGMATGYILLKFKHVKLSKVACICAWCASFAVSVASLYGVHTWNTGNPHGPLLTSVYASLHRTTFAMGVAWVAYACLTGHAGPVNTFLSAKILAPLSRLTFCIYLTQSLVIWTRKASERERMYYSHYNQLYEFVGNFVGSIILAVPLHLLVEAPVSNLDRLIFSRGAPPTSRNDKEGDVPDKKQTKTLSINGSISKSMNSLRTSTISLESTVELKSVKAVHDSMLENGNAYSNVSNDFPSSSPAPDERSFRWGWISFCQGSRKVNVPN